MVRFGLGVYDGHLALADNGILDRLAIHAPSVHEHAVPDYCAVHPGLVFSSWAPRHWAFQCMRYPRRRRWRVAWSDTGVRVTGYNLLTRS